MFPLRCLVTTMFLWLQERNLNSVILYFCSRIIFERSRDGMPPLAFSNSASCSTLKSGKKWPSCNGEHIDFLRQVLDKSLTTVWFGKPKYIAPQPGLGCAKVKLHLCLLPRQDAAGFDLISNAPPPPNYAVVRCGAPPHTSTPPCLLHFRCTFQRRNALGRCKGPARAWE